MLQESMLKYIQKGEIDIDKWNALVKHSENANIFCFSWYLDQFCSWDAIVLDDYKGAIALPQTKKYGFKAVYQPEFIQKCNWFGAQNKDVREIENILLKHYKRIRFNTNLPLFEEHYRKERPNYILHLSSSYSEISSNYSTNIKRNINKAANNLEYKKCSPAICYTLYRDRYENLPNSINRFQFEKLSNLIQPQSDYFKVQCVQSKDELTASCIYVYNAVHKRIHYILGSPTDLGRRLNSMTMLHNKLIKEHSNSSWVFDFEGSEIESVGTFYRKFGTTNEPFWEINLTQGLLLKTLERIYKMFKRL